jgi:hypothetical protein
MGLSFTTAAGPRQRSHSQVRVPRDSVSDSRPPQHGGPGLRIYIPPEQDGPVIAPGAGFPFRRLLRLAGQRWRYSTPPPHGRRPMSSQVLCYDRRQSASLSWNKAPIWELRPDFYYCQTAAGLLVWGALSDERMDLSFTIDPGPCQRSHSRVRVPWDSRPYFTASDSRFPFSSPPTTRRATVDVFNPASTSRITGYEEIMARSE